MQNQMKNAMEARVVKGYRYIGIQIYIYIHK